MWASIVKRHTALLLAGAVLGVAVAGTAAAEDLSAVVHKLTQAQFSLSYHGERHVYNFHPSTPKVTTFRIVHTPKGERREYRTGRFSITVIDDGHHQWMYRPHQNLIVRRPSLSMEQRRSLAQRNAALLIKNYRIEVIQPEETMGGRTCMVAKFAPRFGVGRPVRTLWIDREKGLPLRTEVYDRRGLRVMTFFSSITYSPPSSPEALALRVPPSTRLEAESEEYILSPASLAQAVDFPVLQPKKLPPGFALVNARLKGRGPTAELRLLYSDGLSALTLFERRQSFSHRTGGPKATPVALGDAEGLLYRRGLLRMVEWQRPPVALTLVGEVSEEELLETARSIP
jgi:outer membrane lipoprotein-sorting protein